MVFGCCYWGFNENKHGLFQPRSFRSSQCQDPFGKAKRVRGLVPTVLLQWLSMNRCRLWKMSSSTDPMAEKVPDFYDWQETAHVGVRVLQPSSPFIIPLLLRHVVHELEKSCLWSALDESHQLGFECLWGCTCGDSSNYSSMVHLLITLVYKTLINIISLAHAALCEILKCAIEKVHIHT